MKIKITDKPDETLYIYCRISTKHQSEGVSLDVQEERGLQVSKQLGLSPIVIKEQGSGLKPYIEERPLFTDLMDYVVDGKIKHFWIDEDTRLTRNKDDQGFIHNDFVKNDVVLYVGKDGGIKDLKDWMVDLIDSITVRINERQIRQQVRKSISSKRRLFTQGCYMKGDPPFGYKLVDKKLEIHEENSEWVVKMFDWYDLGKSTVFIRQQLFQNGIKPPRSKEEWWGLNTITKVLQNKNYIGLDVYRELTNECPKIVEKKVFESVQKKIRTSLGRSIETKHDFLLRGIIKCPDGTPMSCLGQKKSRRNPLYGCGHKQRQYKNRTTKTDCPITKSLRTELIDDYTWNLLVDTLSSSHTIKETTKKELIGNNPSYTKRTYNNNIKKLNKQMMDLDTNRLELEKRFYTNQMDKKRFDVLIESIEDKEEELMGKIHQNKMKLESLNYKSKWIDWLDVHSSRMNEIRGITDFNNRRGIINHYIHENIILDYNEETRQHTMTIRFRFPLFDDNFEWLKNKDGSYKLDRWGRRRYNISDGETEMTNPFTLQKSLNRHTFSQVSRHIHIAPSKNG